MTLKIDQSLQQGRYRIRRRLGQGGMGTVYLAEDQNLSKQLVAIKENADTSPETQEQFEREAMLLARLNHPNLPRVTDHFIEPSGRQYLVMDYVHGQELRELAGKEEGPPPETEVIQWIDQVLDALEFMHNWVDPNTGESTCIVHRDIKPSNLRLSNNGRVVLVDFGLAKYQGGEGTLVGARAISPGYSPVEQYTGGTDVRSDIYALGATLYHLLTGQRPPEAPARAAGTTLALPRKLNPAISRNMERVILRALQIQAQERYQSAAEMRDALHNSRRLSFTGRTQTQRYSQRGAQRQQNPFLVWGISLVSLLIVVLLLVPSRFPFSLWNYWPFKPAESIPVTTPAPDIADSTPLSVAGVAGQVPTNNLASSAINTDTTNLLPTSNPTATIASALQTAVSATQSAIAAAATTTAAAQPPTETLSPTATPSPASTATVAPTATLLPTALDQPTPDSQATNAVVLQTAVAATIAAQTLEATAKATQPPPTATPTPTFTPSATASATATATHTAKPPTSTPIAVNSANTNAESATATELPTATPLPTSTATPTLDAQATIDANVKLTLTATTPTATWTPQATATPLPTNTFTPTPSATLPPPTLAPTATDTPSATATRTPSPTATLTATKPPTPTWTPTPTATKVPLQTLTPTPTETPVPTAAPTSTPAPTATSTTSAEPQPTATARPVNFSLIEPLDAVLSGRHIFRWNTNLTLQDNQYFEMVFWPVGQNPMSASFGPAGSVKANEISVDLDKAAQTLPPDLLVYGNEYQWGVLLVEINPYKRLKYLGGGQRFYFGGVAGSGGSSGNEKSKPSAKPTNTPRG